MTKLNEVVRGVEVMKTASSKNFADLCPDMDYNHGYNDKEKTKKGER